MNLERADLETIYRIVKTHLRGGSPDVRAYRIAHEIETALTADTSDTADTSVVGSANTSLGDHGYVDTAEAAKMLGTSDRWARELAASGHIGAVKHAGRWWIPRDALPAPEED